MGIFTQEKKLQDLRTPEQIALGKDYTGSLSRALQGYTPGQSTNLDLNVSMTPQEQASLSYLNQYANNGSANNQAFQAGLNQVLGVLNGSSLDVTQNPYYQSSIAEINRNNQAAIDAANRQAAARGDYYSTGSQRVVGDVLTDTANRKNTLLADLLNQERNRQDSAAMNAIGIGQYQINEPLNVTSALQTYGSLPRLIQESNLTRNYNDYLRQRQELSDALNQSGGASNYGGPVYGSTTYTAPTTLGSLASFAAPIVSSYAGAGGFNKSNKSNTSTTSSSDSSSNNNQMAQLEELLKKYLKQ